MTSQRRVAIAIGAALLVAAVALLVAVAVAADDETDRAADVETGTATSSTLESTTTAPPTTQSTTTTVPARDPMLGNGQAVTLAFGGDVHFEGMIRPKLTNDPASVFASVAPVFEAADLSMVNLETAITERGAPAPKDYTFRTPITALDALRLGHVDVVTMANNHGIDFGPEGLEDTLVAKETGGFPIVGIGRNAAEAYAPWRTEINGQRIAVFGASEVIDSFARELWRATDVQAGMASAYPEGIDALLQQVQAARVDSDTIIVYLHYGRELETCPNDRQKSLVQRLTEAGADVVVGSHAHRLQGAGRHGQTFADYGLGNFVFYNDSGAAADTGVLVLTVTGRRTDSYQWVPARVRGGVPVLLEGPAADQAIASWNALRDCTGLAP